MNEYFRRTPEDFNYDNARYPGEGNLYDLRVATRDEVKRIDATINSMDEVLSNVLGAVSKLIDDMDVAQDHIEALEAVDTSPEPAVSVLVEALKLYADQDNWQVHSSGFAFRLCRFAPWNTAIDALREAGIK